MWHLILSGTDVHPSLPSTDPRVGLLHTCQQYFSGAKRTENLVPTFPTALLRLSAACSQTGVTSPASLPKELRNATLLVHPFCRGPQHPPTLILWCTHGWFFHAAPIRIQAVCQEVCPEGTVNSFNSTFFVVCFFVIDGRRWAAR